MWEKEKALQKESQPEWWHVALVFGAWLVSGFSIFGWFVKRYAGGSDWKDARRVRWWLGFRTWYMSEHWLRLKQDPSGHTAVNIITEWIRVDAQRAGKLAALITCTLLILLVLSWML